MKSIRCGKTPLIYLLMALLSIQTVNVLAQSLEVKDYDQKTTLPIISEEVHQSCRLHSGYNLTMIACSD